MITFAKLKGEPALRLPTSPTQRHRSEMHSVILVGGEQGTLEGARQLVQHLAATGAAARFPERTRP